MEKQQIVESVVASETQADSQNSSLLRGIEERESCRPENLSKEVCCPPGTKIKDVTKRFTQIFKPTGYSNFILFHVEIDDTTKETENNTNSL